MKTEHFRKRLEAEKEKLESEMQPIGRRNPSVPDDWEPSPPPENMESDPVDQAEAIVSQNNEAAILADLEARYDTILETLRNIEKGTYGKCVVCGVEISEARLEANPAATTCAEHMQ